MATAKKPAETVPPPGAGTDEALPTETTSPAEPEVPVIEVEEVDLATGDPCDVVVEVINPGCSEPGQVPPSERKG